MMTLMVITALCNLVTAGHTWSQLVKLVTVKDLKNIYLDVIMVTAVHIWSLSYGHCHGQGPQQWCPRWLFCSLNSFLANWRRRRKRWPPPPKGPVYHLPQTCQDDLQTCLASPQVKIIYLHQDMNQFFLRINFVGPSSSLNVILLTFLQENCHSII